MGRPARNLQAWEGGWPAAPESEEPRRGDHPSKEASTVEGYCVKCKSKKQMENPTKITMKNGKPATRGACPNCGTKIFRIGA